MKLRITKLKAAWPAGAKVGDIIDLPEVPAWAVGKCEPAPEDAEPTIAFPEVMVIESGEATGDLQVRLEQASRAAANALKLAEDARAELAEAQAALQASQAEAEGLRTQLAEAQAALQAKATEPKAKR